MSRSEKQTYRNSENNSSRVACLVAHIRWVLHTPFSMLTGLGDMVCESSEQRALSTGRATAHSSDRAFVRPGLVQTRCMQNE